MVVCRCLIFNGEQILDEQRASNKFLPEIFNENFPIYSTYGVVTGMVTVKRTFSISDFGFPGKGLKFH